MTAIQIITFDEENAATCGVVVQDDGRGRPCLHILELAENKAAPLNQSLLQGCRAVRDQFYPGLPLSEIDWTYTNGICHSDIAFEEQGNHVTKIHLNGNHLGGAHFKLPLKHYNDALQSPDGFEHALTSGHGFIRGTATEIYPVPVPGAPNDTIYFKPNGYDGLQTVLVDAKKFIAAWKEQEAGIIHRAAPQPGAEESTTSRLLKTFFRRAHDNTPDPALESRAHDFKLFESTVEKSRDSIWKNTSPEHPMPTAFLNYAPGEANGAIAFTNGRHRTFNTANLGAPFIAVEVSGDIDSFRREFEWQPEDAQPGSAPHPVERKQYAGMDR